MVVSVYHQSIWLFLLLCTSVTSSSAKIENDDAKQTLTLIAQNELTLKVSHLEETVQQQWVFIKQLAQRVDMQEQMLKKAFKTEDLYVNSNNETSGIQQTNPISDHLIAESDMQMASDDPKVSKENSDSSSSASWAQLKISPNIVGSVHYANFRVNIYEHARNTKTNNNQQSQCSFDFDNKKYYYMPIAMLDSSSASSSYNNVTRRPEMTFWIELWNHQVEKAVTDWVKRNFKDEIISNQIEVIPFEKLIMTSAASSSEEQRNYYLDNVWISYQRQDRVKFKFICYRLDDCDQLARQMRLNPDQFSHLQLHFRMASVESQTRQTKIHVGNIVTGDMATKLLQRIPEGDFVLLTAEDEKRLISESATNIFIETFDDSDVVAPNSQAHINNQLRELLVASRTAIKEQSDKMWDSVFWNEDNYRPDKTTQMWNDVYNAQNKENRAALAKAFKFDGKLEAELSFKLLGGLASVTPRWAASLLIDKSLSKESLDRLYQASKNSVSWNGEKFVPKPLSLARVNLAKLRDQQSLQERNVRLSYSTAVLSIAINIPTKNAAFLSSSNARNDMIDIRSQLQELRLKFKSTPGPVPSNCSSLSKSGHSLNGFYLVAAGRGLDRIKTVYCNFTRLPHNEGYQNELGYNSLTDIKYPSPTENKTIMPTNCNELYKLGHKIDGFYPVKNVDGFKRLDIIHCSFNRPYSNISSVLDEFERLNHRETRIGFADVKTAPVFFHATRKSRFFTTDSQLSFEKLLLNVGQGMDIKTGVFTVPKSGQYLFHFNGFKDVFVNELQVVLRLNGQTDLASVYLNSQSGSSSQLSPFFIHTIASLKAGDKVSLYLMEGSIAGSNDKIGQGNNFFGYLLHQDLSFE